MNLCVCVRERDREGGILPLNPDLHLCRHHVIVSSGLKVMQMASHQFNLHASISDTKGCSLASGGAGRGGGQTSIQHDLSWN